ncbi:MAG: hypothetical protein ACI8PB_003784 [Desulforhopalus sp.]|jgi:hypothetical protein
MLKQTFIAILLTATASIAHATDTIPVTLENYKVAESDVTNGNVIKLGAANKLVHLPVKAFDLSNQTVVRMNQDTIYSAAVVDVSKGATITLPETDGRYQTVMIVQNDHYVNDVFMGAGTYEIKSDTDSDFVQVAVRTGINLSDPADAAKVVALQQAIKLEVKGDKVFKQPNYDMGQLVKLRVKLANEAIALGSQNNMQGARGTVDEHLHLLGTAVGWGLLPDANARYIAYAPEDNTGVCYQANYQIPPFNAPGFFSITMYDAEGWMFNEKAILNKNNITFNEDGSFDANFGECGDNVKNNLPITKGWNFVMRVYEPKLDQLEAYKLPTPIKVK